MLWVRDMELRGKKALVTGAAVRIGEAICLALAREGAEVVIHYRRSAEEAETLKSKIEAVGGSAAVVSADFSDPGAVSEFLRDVFEKVGSLDILINNAAVFHKDGLDELTDDKLVSEFRMNLFTPMLLVSEFGRLVKRGAVINLLDRRIAGLDGTCMPYVLSKKALAEFTRMAALELAPGIRVNGVAPGAILPPPGKGTEYLKDHAGLVPLGDRGTVNDVADAVIGLLKNDAVTGQILFVDGGQHLLGSDEF